MTATYRVEIADDGILFSYGDIEPDTIPLDDVPDLVKALLRRQRPDVARVVNDAWYVAVAQSFGLRNIVLGGGV